MVQWQSLIKFEAECGAEYWASIPLETKPEPGLAVEGFLSIESLESDGKSKAVKVKKLLAPVPVTNVPIICIGLNYRNHAAEASIPVPQDPPMWYKPAAALANPNGVVHVPARLQERFPDFEGELTAVVRDTVKDISASNSRSHILGYTIGNDLTARLFQRSGAGQFTYAKGFDDFAPLGPRLVHPSVFTHESSKIKTRVNGRVVQDSPFDFIFPIDELLSFLSQGTTIPAGTAIMTGTPAGVGWFQDPKSPLKHNDIVEVEVHPIGVLKTEIVFEK